MSTIVEYKGKNGAKYKAIVRIVGQPLRSKTFDSKTKAKDWAMRLELAIKDGEVQDVNKAARTHTAADLIDAYCTEILPTKSHHTRRNEPSILRWWNRHIGSYALTQVTPEMISRNLLRLAGESDRRRDAQATPSTGRKSKQTIKHYRDTLSRVFRTAVEWRWIASNPIDKVPRVRNINNQRVRFLDRNECARLLEACRTSEQAFLYPIVVFSLSTGARYSEILGLTLRDVDLAHGFATFRKTKNGDTKRVHIRGHLAQVLADQVDRVETFYGEHHKGTRWLFPREDGLGHVNIHTAWRTARTKAKLQDFRFHDLRHTAASYLAMNGATLLEIATVLGHRTLAMVKRYAHLSDQHTAAVVERMNSNLFAVSPEPQQQLLPAVIEGDDR